MEKGENLEREKRRRKERRLSGGNCSNETYNYVSKKTLKVNIYFKNKGETRGENNKVEFARRTGTGQLTVPSLKEGQNEKEKDRLHRNLEKKQKKEEY